MGRFAHSAPDPQLCIERPGVLSFHCCVLSASRKVWCLAGTWCLAGAVGVDRDGGYVGSPGRISIYLFVYFFID